MVSIPPKKTSRLFVAVGNGRVWIPLWKPMSILVLTISIIIYLSTYLSI